MPVNLQPCALQCTSHRHCVIASNHGLKSSSVTPSGSPSLDKPLRGEPAGNDQVTAMSVAPGSWQLAPCCRHKGSSGKLFCSA